MMEEEKTVPYNEAPPFEEELDQVWSDAIDAVIGVLEYKDIPGEYYWVIVDEIKKLQRK